MLPEENWFIFFFFTNWRKSQLYCSTHGRWVFIQQNECADLLSLGTRQKQSRIHIKWHKPPFGTIFCTWGSTAGPCPANLCRELTWGTLMGTAVIVPKVCWKKNSWTQLKTLAQLPQIESAWPSGSPSSSLLVSSRLMMEGYNTSVHLKLSLFCLKSQRLFLLFNLLYKALLTEVCCLLRAFGNTECKGYISSLWSFFGTSVLPWLKAV